MSEFSPGVQKAVQELMAIFDCKATTRQWERACRAVDDASNGALPRIEKVTEYCEFGDGDHKTKNKIKMILRRGTL